MSDSQGRTRALIGEPVALPLKVAAQVAWSSIKVRMSRSLVTVSSVVLAVAFLLVVLGGEISSAAVHKNWTMGMGPANDASTVRNVLVRPRKALTMLTLMAEQPDVVKTWSAAQGIDLTVPPAADLSQTLSMIDWVENLKASQRYLVTRNQSPVTWALGFTAEAGDAPAKADEFLELISTFKGIRLEVTKDELIASMNAMPAIAQASQLMADAERNRLAKVAESGGAEALITAIVKGTASDALSAQGLPLDQLIGDDASRRSALENQLTLDQQRNAIGQALASANATASGELNLDSSEVRPLMLPDIVDGSHTSHPAWPTAQKTLSDTVEAGAFEAVIANLQDRRRLDALGATLASMNYDPVAGKERTFWLVVLSLLVCIVGIVNSMMMAVTERFREIATMKCLGAVDGFILKAFLIESGSIGLVGAFLGALIGLILALVQGSARFGGTFWASFPAGGLSMALLGALVTGIVLTIAGALLPAYKAARMHPIEAMRLEA